jgi:hypothetical protein
MKYSTSSRKNCPWIQDLPNSGLLTSSISQWILSTSTWNVSIDSSLIQFAIFETVDQHSWTLLSGLIACFDSNFASKPRVVIHFSASPFLSTFRSMSMPIAPWFDSFLFDRNAELFSVGKLLFFHNFWDFIPAKKARKNANFSLHSNQVWSVRSSVKYRQTRDLWWTCDLSDANHC